MEMFTKYFPVLLMWTCAAACSPDYVTPEELTAYLLEEENGVHRSVEIDGVRIDVTHRPTDVWVNVELGGDEADPGKVVELREKYDPYLYFVLSLSRDGREALHQVNRWQYSELVQTMSFRMPEYVTMTTGEQDTIPVGDFMLNRTYGMSSSTDLLFVFSREKLKNTEWVQFNLNEFGLGVGNQRFRFRVRDLENVPKIYKTG